MTPSFPTRRSSDLTMLPFGTMSPTKSLEIARAVYAKVPYLTNVFEQKFNQKLIGLITDNGYNLGTTFDRSDEHTSELQSLMRISYAVFCLKKKILHNNKTSNKKAIQQ